MSPKASIIWFCLTLSLLALEGCDGAGGPITHQSPNEATIVTAGLSRSLRLAPTLTTVKVVNNFTGQSYDTYATEFSLMVDDYAGDFSGNILSSESFAPNGPVEVTSMGVRVPLKNPSTGLNVTVHYDADGTFFIHKWLEIVNTGSISINISRIELENIQLTDASVSFPSQVYHDLTSIGQNRKCDGPVYADNLFLALEFPVCDNRMDGNHISLRHFPGHTLQPGESMTSKKVVMGASPNRPLHRNKDYFFRYIEQAIARPPTNFKIYNTWFQLYFKQTEDLLLKAIDNSVKPLKARGISLDGFVVDDGWQDRKSLWDCDLSMIPSGLGPQGEVQKRLRKYGTSLNLWMPLTGQYGLGPPGEEETWYQARGYETGDELRLCLAPGNRIFHAKGERVSQWVKDGVNSFKADFALLGCGKSGHAHLPGPDYGMEADIEGAIEIIDNARKINPSLFYYLTTVINKNPWWLHSVNVLWESFVGDVKYYYGNQEPTPAQARMSGRDEWHWQHTMHWFVPQRNYMTHGIIGSSDPTNFAFCTEDELTQLAVLYYARGVMWTELYVTEMPDSYWDRLVEVISWADDNRDLLLQQPAMSGGPSQGIPYCWSHFLVDRGLIVARNPSANAQTLSLVLGEAARMEEVPGRSYRVFLDPILPLASSNFSSLGILHYGDTVSLSLQPWEMQVIRVEPLYP